jgi:hypothetical protein
MTRTVDVGGGLDLYRSGGGDMGSIGWHLEKETLMKSRDDVFDMWSKSKFLDDGMEQRGHDFPMWWI